MNVETVSYYVFTLTRDEAVKLATALHCWDTSDEPRLLRQFPEELQIAAENYRYA